MPVAPLTEQTWREYERCWALRPSLGKGELQAIAFCKTAGAFFVTNDRVARRFARDQGVQVISFQALLRGLWMSGVRSKDEVRVLLERIKAADALEVSPVAEGNYRSARHHNSRIAEALEFHPQWSLERGVRATVNWARQRAGLAPLA